MSKTAFAVAKLNVMANVLEETRMHGGLISAFLKEMRNLQGLADFGSCETSFRNGSEEVPTMWLTLAAFLMVPLGETWKGKLEDEK